MIKPQDRAKLFMKELLPYVLIIYVTIMIKTFVGSPIVVNGSSMYPTLEDKDLLILNKLDKSYERFDIVVLDYRNENLVKRIVGLPGETIEFKGNKLYINGEELEDQFAKDTYMFNLSELSLTRIPDDCYFVLGDNRNNSLDSRRIGPVKTSEIKGTVKFGISPFGMIPKYNS